MPDSSRLQGLSARAALTAGVDMWSTRDDPSLGVAGLLLSDGPNGVRGSTRDERRPALCTPCGTALGASWDPALVERVGGLIAAEARRQSVHVVLGPTINIQRSPLGGRGFESFAEDPLLAGRLAVSWITGVQRDGVAACPKHFVANDSETSRTTVDCIVDERALREIYLVPFELALRGGAWAMMAAYNRVNGTYACENRSLLVDLVKTEWSWDGVVVSDWYAPKDTVACARGGLDLEMPGPERVFGTPLAQAVRSGSVPAAELEDKVERLRRLARRVAHPVSPASGSARPGGAGPEDPPALLAEAAAAGIVLLTNRNGTLPLARPGRPWRIALVGPHATYPSLQGGGSAEVNLLRSVRTVEDAVQEQFPDAEVVVHAGCPDDSMYPPLERLDLVTAPGSTTEGITVRYFDESGRLTHQEVRRSSALVWDDGVPGTGPGGGRVEVSAVLRPAVSGDYVFSVRGSGATTIRVDDRFLAALPDQTRPDDPQAPFFSDLWAEGRMTLTADVPVVVTVSMELRTVNDTLPVLCFGCRPPSAPDLLDRAVAAARDADAAVVVVGNGRESEAESTDRTSTALPADQDALVRAVLAVQPSTVVAVNAGAAVQLPWAGEAGAVLFCWFPGQGFADALAGVLSGELEPGGRLPVTLAAKERDYPALRTVPDAEGRLKYTESVFVGYRHFETEGHTPAFPFGHGLGYTTFDFCEVTKQPLAATDALAVSVQVRNVGSRPGKEVVQLYVSPPTGPVRRPPKELKAFAPVRLAPGETGTVQLHLTRRAFSHWDVARGEWAVQPGTYRLLVGRSSADIRLSSEVWIDRSGRITREAP